MVISKHFLLFCLLLSFSVSPSYAQQRLPKLKKTIKTNQSFMKIEIWSDIVCPFCYIGKRKLEQALAQHPNKSNIKLEWKSYQLDPEATVGENKSYIQSLKERKGWTDEQIQQILANVTTMAKEVGLEYKFEKAIAANSLMAHKLIHYAHTLNKQNEAEEALFKAHFIDGIDIGDKSQLLDIALSLGLNKEKTEDALLSDTYAYAVAQDIQEAANLRVTGVPFFVFNRKYAISGAQEISVFSNTLKKAYNEWEKENPNQKLEIIEGKSCKPNNECLD